MVASERAELATGRIGNRTAQELWVVSEETGYVVSERDGTRLKLVRDPGRAPEVPDGWALRDLLEDLLRVNRMLVGDFRLEDVFSAVLDIVIGLVRAEGASLVLQRRNDGPEPVCHRSAVGLPPAAMELSSSVIGEVMSTGRAVLTYDASHDERFEAAASVVAQHLRSVICVPLRVDRDVRGCLYAGSRQAPGLFSPKDLFLIEAFADQAALAVEIARLHERDRQMAQALRQQLDARTEELEAARAQLEEQFIEQSLRYRYDRIVHRSEAMRGILEIVDRVTDSDLPVLIIGESGTGKELLARAVHYNGPRREAPFVAVNCGAVSANLFESEFFGHTKGAFTGAERNRKGHFEAAHGGTLFLDELGELDLAMQVKLLRVLQEREVVPVGSSLPVPIDVRIVAATNRPLEQLVRAGSFREDLFYRVSVVRLDVPPLRDRPDDIEELARRFASMVSERTGKPFELPADILRQMRAYSWPGNVRELENAVNYLSVFGPHGLGAGRNMGLALPFMRDRATDLAPPATATATAAELESADVPSFAVRAGDNLADVERRLIEMTLEWCDGNKNQAAATLGIDRGTIYRKLRSYEG